MHLYTQSERWIDFVMMRAFCVHMYTGARVTVKSRIRLSVCDELSFRKFCLLIRFFFLFLWWVYLINDCDFISIFVDYSFFFVFARFLRAEQRTKTNIVCMYRFSRRSKLIYYLKTNIRGINYEWCHILLASVRFCFYIDTSFGIYAIDSRTVYRWSRWWFQHLRNKCSHRNISFINCTYMFYLPSKIQCNYAHLRVAVDRIS